MACMGKKKSGQHCGSTVYKCKNCDTVGCDHALEETCSKQNFEASRCLSCGKVAGKERV